MRRTIFALFDDILAAQRAAGALERHGFERERMSILAPDPHGRHTRGGPNRSFTPVPIQGLGAAAVAGPLTGMIGAAGTAGDFVGTLRDVGFGESAALHYFESLRRNQSLLAVPSPPDRIDDAVEVMRQLGARAVDDTAFDDEDNHAIPERAPEASADLPAAPPREAFVDQVKVPVVEEQLEVGKRQVSRGGVRVHSAIVEEPIERSISLREERLIVDRRPVYRDATDADLADFKEGTIEVHETIEEPVITKRRRVVEEIVIGRETRERTETITDTVRRTQVRVETMGFEDGDDADGPAHRYGERLARDERYRGASWEDVEPHARREWDEDGGSWEQIKDAVRGAWQKVSGR